MQRAQNSLRQVLRRGASGSNSQPCSSRALTTKAGEWLEGPLGDDTKYVHAGVKPDKDTGAILTPCFFSTTFVQESVEEYLAKGYSYSRTNNPTVAAFEQKVAELEGGYGAACFGTGMAATTTIFAGWLKQGDHCVISECSYGGTNRIAREHFTGFGIEYTFCDFRDVETIKKNMKPNTKMVFSETPANPVLSLVDLEAVSKLAHDNGCVHVVDSTFATPVMLRPLDHGADLVLQSTTKFYDGHNITNGGAVVCATKELYERAKHVQNMHGNIMTPMVAYFQLQTAKTMGLRVKKQSENAQKIAEYLEGHSKVTKVYYPGLKSFPQKELADRYHRNGIHGAMLWFDVEGGSPSGVKIMNTIQRPWSLCENLGATESIITACAVMTHANMLKEDREKVGISDGFIRVSTGIEDADDLIKALDQSLAQI